MTLTGCVYQASDQPTVFALQRTADDMTASASSADNPNTQSGAAGTTGAGSTATAGSRQSSRAAQATTGAAASRENEVGGWYRLSADATQDLKQYVGDAVRINGSLVPGKDEQGADIVVHHIEPGKTTVTALDLKPAPQLRIQTITPAQGQCPQADANR